MNWNEAILNMTTIWNILNFEIILVSNDTDDVLQLQKNSQMLLTLEAHIKQNLTFSPFKTNNMLIFYKTANTIDFLTTFKQVALAQRMDKSSLMTSDNSVYHFVIWSQPLESSVNETKLCTEIGRLNASRLLSLNSNVFIMFSNLEGQVLIAEVYFVHESVTCRNLPISNFAEITNKVRRRTNFHSIVITATAAVQENTAGEVAYQEVNGRIVSATGSAVRIFTDLADMLNFKGNFTRGDWVMRNYSNGKLFGVSVDQLNMDEAQLYLTQTTLAPYRATGFNFLQPTFQDALNAFFQQPPSSTVTDVHLSPFQTSLWLSIFATWTLLSISVFTISSIRAHLELEGNVALFSKFDKFHEAFIWAVGAGCTQGWYKFPNSTSLRIVLFCGAASGFVIFVTYSGAVISSLTSEVAPIQTLRDLISSSLDICFDQDSSTLRYIVQDLRNTTRRKGSDYTGTSVASGLTSIMNRPSGLFAFSRNLYFEASKMNVSAQELCGCISSVPIQKLPLLNGMLVPKWSPYRESFNYRIIQLKERGFNFRYSKAYRTESSISCPKVLTSYREDLGLLDVFTAFEILGGGALVSILIFTIEKCILATSTRLRSHQSHNGKIK